MENYYRILSQPHFLQCHGSVYCESELFYDTKENFKCVLCHTKLDRCRLKEGNYLPILTSAADNEEEDNPECPQTSSD